MWEATIIIERHDHRLANSRGELEIWVRGHVGHIEAPTRHCPGDHGSVDLEAGPYDIEHRERVTRTVMCRDGYAHSVSGMVQIDTVLSNSEEDRAEEELREAVANWDGGFCE